MGGNKFPSTILYLLHRLVQKSHDARGNMSRVPHCIWVVELEVIETGWSHPSPVIFCYILQHLHNLNPESCEVRWSKNHSQNITTYYVLLSLS
jgi:hypothetical protein